MARFVESGRGAGRWPWKAESAKECGNNHLPNQPALKCVGAGAAGRTPAAAGRQSERQAVGRGAGEAGERGEGPLSPAPPHRRYASTSRRAEVEKGYAVNSS